MFIISAPSACSTVELLTLPAHYSFQFPIWLLFHQGFLFGVLWCFSFFCPGYWELCFLAELSECPVKPPCYHFPASGSPHRANDKGRKKKHLQWCEKFPVRKKRSKRAGIRAHSAWSQATGRPAITWAGPVHDWSNITSLGTQGARLPWAPDQLCPEQKRLAPDTELCSPCCKMPLYRNGACGLHCSLRQLLKWKGSMAQWNK